MLHPAVTIPNSQDRTSQPMMYSPRILPHRAHSNATFCIASGHTDPSNRKTACRIPRRTAPSVFPSTFVASEHARTRTRTRHAHARTRDRNSVILPRSPHTIHVALPAPTFTTATRRHNHPSPTLAYTPSCHIGTSIRTTSMFANSYYLRRHTGIHLRHRRLR